MDGEGCSGRDGGDRAGPIVRRAHEFRARARRPKTSGEAGRVTASYLDPHSGDGWFVLHDIGAPRGTGSIDHLAVTPAGVFVIRSLEWPSESSPGGSGRRIGRQLPRREADAMRMSVRAVSDILVSAFPEIEVEPQGVVSLTGGPSVDGGWQAAGIQAVPAGRLVRHLTNGPPLYDPDRVELFALALDKGLASCAGRPSSLVRPPPLPGPAPTSTSAGGEGWRTGGRTLQNVLRPLLAVVGVVLFFYFFAMWSRALPRVTTGAPGASSAWMPPTGTSVSLRSSWSCPTGDRGWTASLAWPAGAPPGPWMAEVSASPFGPWAITRTAGGAAQPTLTGLRPGSRQWIEVGTSYQLMTSAPILKGLLVVPNGC
jgi:hypothetical protein